MVMKKITPFLWFDKNLKEITDFYTSVFPEAKLKTNGTLSDTPSGEVEMATLEIYGQELSLMTAGPMFKFNEAISFVIKCENQEEIDYYWSKLSADPRAEQCGWLKDKFGVSWQVVPRMMSEIFKGHDEAALKRVTAAFLKMKKFDIEKIKKAQEGV
jgi:predicted 3-demethylubiquinone-9 3-methyltransferase (glyoxalase superfamily)